MRLPRVRFTVRRMMVAVAVVAVPLGAITELKRRRDRFQWLGSYHAGKTGMQYINSFSPRPRFSTPRGYWHYELSRKYMIAAERPWLPVDPDPPDPGPPDPY